jgi:hypothetical protein
MDKKEDASETRLGESTADNPSNERSEDVVDFTVVQDLDGFTTQASRASSNMRSDIRLRLHSRLCPGPEAMLAQDGLGNWSKARTQPLFQDVATSRLEKLRFLLSRCISYMRLLRLASSRRFGYPATPIIWDIRLLAVTLSKICLRKS